MFNFFKFFQKPIFGLDISDHSVDVVVLNTKDDKIFLSKYGHIKLEPGVVDNGKVLDCEKLSYTLSQTLKNAQPNAITTKKLILSLPASRVFTHFFKLSKGLNNKVSENLILKRVTEDIPIDLNKCFYDYKVIEENGESFRVFFVACPKDTLDSYLKIFSQLKLKPVAVDLENFCAGRVLIPAKLTETPFMLLDIGARTTTVSVFKKKNLIFTSSIPLAGNYFNEVLIKEKKITETEAKKLKKIFGLSTKAKNSQVKSILEKALQEIVVELKKILEYMEYSRGEKIAQVIMCGGSSKMPEIDKYFAEQLGLDTKIGTYQITIPDNLQIDSILLADAIGLALRGLEKDPAKAGINLLT